jgi:glycosyltransferase involved in cell wall biosynthesis
MIPLVSISCITFNHAPYIRGALESFLSQKTTFPFEVLIHDDASTDGTAEIIQEYELKYPNLIFPLYQKQNQYSMGIKMFSVIYNFPRARGKYFALCEGDDYWIDSLKLQKQVDFLENNYVYSICGHWVKNVDADSKLLREQRFTGQYCPEIFKIEHALGGTPIHTSSLMFRNNDYKQIMRDKYDLFTKLPAGDDPLLLLLLTKGDGYCFQEFMGAYRIHPGGTWSTKPELIKRYKMLLFYYTIPQLIGNHYPEKVNQQIKAGEHAVVEELLYATPRTFLKFLQDSSTNELMPKRRIPFLLINSLLYFIGKVLERPWNFTRRILGRPWDVMRRTIGRMRKLIYKRVHKL